MDDSSTVYINTTDKYIKSIPNDIKEKLIREDVNYLFNRVKDFISNDELENGQNNINNIKNICVHGDKTFLTDEYISKIDKHIRYNRNNNKSINQSGYYFTNVLFIIGLIILAVSVALCICLLIALTQKYGDDGRRISRIGIGNHRKDKPIIVALLVAGVAVCICSEILIIYFYATNVLNNNE